MDIRTYLETYGEQIPLIREAVKTRLEALPDDVEEIAEVFSQMNIQSLCGDPYRCAVADYLAPVMPAGWMVEVDGSVRISAINVEDEFSPFLLDEVDFNEDVEDEFDSIWTDSTIQTRGSVREFIRAFDRKEFPNLMEA